MGPEDIKHLRLKLGWSQERFAREVGVSFSTVNRWERGRTFPSPMAVAVLKRLKENSGLNYRSSPRLDVRRPLNIMKNTGAEDGGKTPLEPFFSVSENLSHGGLMFRTHSDIGPGEVLDIYLNSADNEYLRILSSVVWTEDLGAERKVGVRFDDVDPKGISRLMSAVRRV